MSSWSNLEILNEWRRLFPERDPLEFHESLWGARLVCAGGGDYVWNETWKTMESTVYGHPLQPREGPQLPGELRAWSVGDAGLTFEDDGVRARVEIQR